MRCKRIQKARPYGERDQDLSLIQTLSSGFRIINGNAPTFSHIVRNHCVFEPPKIHSSTHPSLFCLFRHTRTTVAHSALPFRTTQSHHADSSGILKEYEVRLWCSGEEKIWRLGALYIDLDDNCLESFKMENFGLRRSQPCYPPRGFERSGARQHTTNITSWVLLLERRKAMMTYSKSFCTSRSVIAVEKE